ncbi:type VII toxin-antitoxin system MntA family adenylyltransferase antitoxin [Endozoicomonas sp. ALC020]|uniref:type VII toxin-antitoxin system MntA family adenylyltransferase antitoxin n=1 Tax=unclassified Endozoicomonas TaxID=2644528 RepID=UPI003BAE25BD
MHADLDASYIEESLRAAFGKTLLGVVLYGSQATGHATAGSDIDLAVFISGKTSQQLLWDKAQELACHFGKYVDLIDLKGATTVLQKEVFQHGVWMARIDEMACDLFETHVFSHYQQLQEDRREIINDLLSRIKNG